MARDYKKEYETYQGTEEQKKNRVMRNADRNSKKGLVSETSPRERKKRGNSK